jgi:hypothetical protein
VFGKRGDFIGEPIDIDDVGIEVVSDPFAELGVALVLGIADRVKELGIAPRTADVFGWAAAGGLDQARIDEARLGIEEPTPIGAMVRSTRVKPA